MPTRSTEDHAAASTLADDLRRGLASGDEAEIAAAIGDIGRADLREHAGLVARCLDHPSCLVRTRALEVLGKTFDDASVAPLALVRFGTEVDPLARASALSVWAWHHRGERAAVAFLFAVASDEREPESLRRLAWMSTFSAAGAPTSQWLHRDQVKERAPLADVLAETRAADRATASHVRRGRAACRASRGWAARTP